jgi:mutator protein MutT
MSGAESTATPFVEIAVAVVERDGKLLIGQRPAGTALAGYWEFPGGKMEPGESPAQAAVRECLEESGLVIRIVGQHSVVEYAFQHGRMRIHFLLALPEKSSQPLPARFRWVPAVELADYAFPAANAALVQELSARRAAAPPASNPGQDNG